MDFDDFLEKIGSFGKAQAIIFSVPALLTITCAFHTVAPVFLFYTPEHRCRLPSSSAFYANDTFAVQSLEHKQELLANLPASGNGSGGFAKCSGYGVANGSREEVDCSHWVFDRTQFLETFVTETQLVCNKSPLATVITTCTFAGFLVGVLVAGVISDLIGRRSSLLMFVCVYAASALGSAFARTAAAMAVGRFFLGFGALGAFTIGFVIGTEIVGPESRFHTGIAIEYFWTFGTASLAGIAYLIRDWQGLQVAVSVPIFPILLAALVPLLAPESPRWLLSRGRAEEAKKIAGWMARVNDSEECVGMLDAVLASSLRSEEEAKVSKLAVLRQLLCSARWLLLRFAIVCFNWFVISLVYYGLTMGVKNLPGSIYLTSLLNGLVEFPAYLMCHVTVNRFGRKRTHIFCMVAGGFALVGLLVAFVKARDVGWLIITLSMLGKLFNTAAFGVVYLWTAELYPTNIRNIGVSASSLFARVGTLFAPVLADIRNFMPGEGGTVLAYSIFAAVTLAAAAAALLLPETLGCKLADSLQQMMNGGRESSGCCAETPPASAVPDKDPDEDPDKDPDVDLESCSRL